MKICFYAMREYDEVIYAKKFAKEMGIDFVYTDEYPNEKNMELAIGSDAISSTPCDLSAPVLKKFHELGVKNILCRSIGYDHVDLAVARKLGMHVTNVSYPPNGVANYAIMLMMMAARNVDHAMQRAKIQDYSLKGKIGKDITGMTVGVIGTGKIGSTVIKHLSGFGSKILAYDLYPNEEVKRYATYVSLEELLKESDVITLHANVTENNLHLINRDTLALTKKGVIIVNTARGKLIDTKALIEALRAGHVGACALDVLENENGLYYYNRMGEIIDNYELAILDSMPNVILTPHTAFYTEENVSAMVLDVFKAEKAIHNGEEYERIII